MNATQRNRMIRRMMREDLAKPEPVPEPKMRKLNVLVSDESGNVIDSIAIELADNEGKIALVPLHDIACQPAQSIGELRARSEAE